MLIPSIARSYSGSAPSHFFSDAGAWAETADRTIGLCYHSAFLGAQMAEDTATQAQCRSIANVFGEMAGTWAALRVVLPIESLVSGKMFYNFEKNEFRNLEDFAMGILGLVARVFSCMTWLHNHDVCDLGNHTKAISDTSMGIWGAVIALDIISNGRELYTLHTKEELTPEVKSEKTLNCILNIVCDAIDLAALPYDFGYGMNGPPELAIVGAILNIVSKGGYLVKEVCLHGI